MIVLNLQKSRKGNSLMEFEFKENLDKELEKLIDNEFEEYANEHNLSCQYKRFNCVAKEQNKIVGFLTGYTVCDELYIDELLVLKLFRGKGIGTQLIKQTEKWAKNQSQLKYINLVTCKFQAPEFYKKCGFKLEFVRENKITPALTKYFFIKYI